MPRKPNPYPVCVKCKQALPRDAFDTYQSNGDTRIRIYPACRECRARSAQPPSPNCVCEQCGKAFYMRPSVAATQRFCSRRCRGDAHTESLNLTPPNPSGLCQCGCGEMTSIAKQSVPEYGHVKGEHVRFRTGHVGRISPVEYIEQDCGYISPCWVWQRARDHHEYGMSVYPNGQKGGAHRIVYERHRGPIPEGLELDHLCRNPPCVNPDHLEPVTRSVNSQRGVRTQLTAAQVVSIKRLLPDHSNREIADRFGVSLPIINNIRKGVTWKNVA